MKYTHDPDGTRLPIKLDTTTNGEFAPIALEDVHLRARHAALERLRCIGPDAFVKDVFMVPHLRSEDAARVPEPQGVGRLTP